MHQTQTIQRARSLRKKLTDAERKLWYEIRCKKLDGLRFRRQVPFGVYIADFACFESKIIIELDGSQHANDDALRYDRERTRYLESFGYKVLRFWNHEIFLEIDRIKQIIWDNCFLTLSSGATHHLPPKEENTKRCFIAFLRPLPVLRITFPRKY